MNSLDIDETIGYVSKIIENVRCATCDKLEGSRLRYPCGHTACDNCVSYSEDCPTCISPSRSPVGVPKPDYPLTQVVENACDLLKICHNLFGVDAFHRKQISEQLRIEKELFPKCIQAPVKYENKRKSKNLSFNNKENNSSAFFPGEATSSPKHNIMENSVKNVQQWFSKNETRKPFADLHVNKNVFNQKDKVVQNVKDKNVGLHLNQKRSFIKTTDNYIHPDDNKKKLVYDFDKSPKKVKIEKSLKKEEIHKNSEKNKTGESLASFISSTSDIQKKCDNDESGIFMDNDPIVIDDSQETVTDKDKRAWLAVLEACKDENLESTSLYTSSQVYNTNDYSKPINNSYSKKGNGATVPFFKKGAITETCKYCKIELHSSEPVLAQSQQPVKITIDGGSFLTTITVFKNVESNVMNSTNSVSIQTNSDKTSPHCMGENNSHDQNGCLNRDENLNEFVDGTLSQDLFVDDRKIFEEVAQISETKCVVIEESDTDSDLDISGPVSVKADVHRSCEESEYGTLTEIVDLEEHDRKPRRGPRGLTPTSTDSSEKENYNPNRMKKRINTKKKTFKK